MTDPQLMCSLADVKIELWIDDPIKRVLSTEYFDALRDHGVDTIAVMVDASQQGWNPKYSTKTIVELAQLCKDYGIELALTDWPYPDKKQIDEMIRQMTDLILAAGPMVGEWEDDMEFNWTRRKVKGFKNIDEAGDHWLERKGIAIREIEDSAAFSEHEDRVLNSLTTFTAHTENGRASDVAPYVDLLFPQAYSVRNRAKKNPETGRYDIPWQVPERHTYGPGNMQRHTLDRTMMISGIDDGHPEMGCGLAAYDQNGWPMGALNAMAMAVDVSVGEYNVKRLRYWSSKWVIGVRSKKNQSASRFLKLLKETRALQS